MNGWRRAAVGLIAGAATAIAALPAHADAARTAAHPGATKAASVRAATPSYPMPAHRHHPVASHAPATANTNSKRAPGHAGAAITAPAVELGAAVDGVARPIATADQPQRIASATAARAPPARQ